MKRTGVGCVWIAAVFAGVAQCRQGQPDVKEIIRRSVAATQEDWKLAPDYAFMERDIESKKDRDYQWVLHHVDRPAEVGFEETKYTPV